MENSNQDLLFIRDMLEKAQSKGVYKFQESHQLVKSLIALLKIVNEHSQITTEIIKHQQQQQQQQQPQTEENVNIEKKDDSFKFEFGKNFDLGQVDLSKIG
tara:strand:- start:71 stop:373 length:303 start_codon:yes stop_codon:yes gene_type:complete